MNRRQATIAVSIAAASFSLAAEAQGFPERPITLVVPQPPGGAADALARALGEEMGRRLGTTVVVENRPGASGMLGANAVARAKSDGYTLLMTNSTPLLTLPYLLEKVPYDTRRDFRFVTQIASGQLMVVANPEVPARTMKDLIAWVARNKGKVSYGSFGIGTSGHLVAAHLNRSQNLDMTHVPFKGETPMIQELLAGRIAFGIATGAVLQHVQSGRLNALAVIADQRIRDLPNVPTMAEAGLTDNEFKPMGWWGLLAPAGTPAPVLARLEKDARDAIATPALKARIESLGMDAVGSSSADFIKAYEQLAPVAERMVRVSGARLE